MPNETNYTADDSYYTAPVVSYDTAGELANNLGLTRFQRVRSSLWGVIMATTAGVSGFETAVGIEHENFTQVSWAGIVAICCSGAAIAAYEKARGIEPATNI